MNNTLNCIKFKDKLPKIKNNKSFRLKCYSLQFKDTLDLTKEIDNILPDFPSQPKPNMVYPNKSFPFVPNNSPPIYQTYTIGKYKPRPLEILWDYKNHKIVSYKPLSFQVNYLNNKIQTY